MLRLMIVLPTVLLSLAAAAAAQPGREACDLPHVAHDWDFALGDHGFLTTVCEDEGDAVWEYGGDPLFPSSAVWCTRLGVTYQDGAGESLLPPPFVVTEQSYLVDLHHWYSIEGWWDGGNVTANGEVIVPAGGYPADAVSPDPSGDPFCVDGEPGFTSSSSGWRHDCFDLSAFMGQTVQLAFDFGSDATVGDDGWYLAAVRVGGQSPVATSPAAWGSVKARYR